MSDQSPAEGIVHPCRTCGAMLYRDDRYCPCCGAEAALRCGECGAEIVHEHALYCTRCGAAHRIRPSSAMPGGDRRA